MELASPELNESTIKLSGTFPEKDGTSPTEGEKTGPRAEGAEDAEEEKENLLHHRGHRGIKIRRLRRFRSWV
jgi:hypothetical protein